MVNLAEKKSLMFEKLIWTIFETLQLFGLNKWNLFNNELISGYTKKQSKLWKQCTTFKFPKVQKSKFYTSHITVNSHQRLMSSNKRKAPKINSCKSKLTWRWNDGQRFWLLQANPFGQSPEFDDWDTLTPQIQVYPDLWITSLTCNGLQCLGNGWTG